MPNAQQAGDNECRAFQLENGCHQCGRTSCHDMNANCVASDTRTRPTYRPGNQCFINATLTAIFSAAPIRAALDAALARMEAVDAAPAVADLATNLKALSIRISAYKVNSLQAMYSLGQQSGSLGVSSSVG